MNGVENRRFLLTGAAGGIGRAIAAALTGSGAALVATDIDAEGLARTRERAGPSCETCRLDVTDEDEISAVISAHGPFDGLVYSAGGVAGQVGRPIESVTRMDWNRVSEINLTGAFLLARAVSGGMKARSSGSIVMISSGAGIDVSLTGIQAYASAKAGQLGLVRQLAHELGPWNINVNAVAPGFVRSNEATERQWHALGEQGQQELIGRIALRRIGTPEDIAQATLFLASRSSWITGQVLRVDGGR